MDVRVESCELLLQDFPKLQSVLTDPPSMQDERARFVILVESPNNPDDVERVRCRVWCHRNLNRYRNSPDKEERKVLAETSPPMLIHIVDNYSPRDAERLMKIDMND